MSQSTVSFGRFGFRFLVALVVYHLVLLLTDLAIDGPVPAWMELALATALSAVVLWPFTITAKANARADSDWLSLVPFFALIFGAAFLITRWLGLYSLSMFAAGTGIWMIYLVLVFWLRAWAYQTS